MASFRSPHDQGNVDLNRGKKTALRWAIALSFFAFLFQVAGAIYTSSLALLGDTAHLFTDVISLVISLVAVTLVSVPTTKHRSYGLFRLEVLAAFLNGLGLVLVALWLAWESVLRLLHPEPVKALPLVVVATAGMLVNLLSAWILSRAMNGEELAGLHAHSHSHDHDHGHADHHGHAHHSHENSDGHACKPAPSQATQASDRNLHGALLHVLSDALGSLAVVVGAVITYFTDWAWIDPALAILLSGLMIRWSIRLLLDSGHVLLEGTPRHLRCEQIEASMRAVDPRVKAVEDLHVWEITSRMYVATAEVKVEGMSLAEADSLRQKMEQGLRQEFGIAHSVLALKP